MDKLHWLLKEDVRCENELMHIIVKMRKKFIIESFIDFFFIYHERNDFISSMIDSDSNNLVIYLFYN